MAVEPPKTERPKRVVAPEQQPLPPKRPRLSKSKTVEDRPRASRTAANQKEAAPAVAASRSETHGGGGGESRLKRERKEVIRPGMVRSDDPRLSFAQPKGGGKLGHTNAAMTSAGGGCAQCRTPSLKCAHTCTLSAQISTATAAAAGQSEEAYARSRQQHNQDRSSEFFGVLQRSYTTQFWSARLKHGGVVVLESLFESEDEAALAYDAAARKHRRAAAHGVKTANQFVSWLNYPTAAERAAAPALIPGAARPAPSARPLQPSAAITSGNPRW